MNELFEKCLNLLLISDAQIVTNN